MQSCHKINKEVSQRVLRKQHSYTCQPFEECKSFTCLSGYLLQWNQEINLFQPGKRFIHWSLQYFSCIYRAVSDYLKKWIMVQEFFVWGKKLDTENMDEHTMLKTAKIPQLWVCKIKQKKAKNKRNCWGLLADRSNHSSLIPESHKEMSLYLFLRT